LFGVSICSLARVSLSSTRVHEGQTTGINATVANEGKVSDNSNVVAFFDDKAIQSCYNVVLDARAIRRNAW
jgi:hypothetical protein